jgi:hypothetical protein
MPGTPPPQRPPRPTKEGQFSRGARGQLSSGLDNGPCQQPKLTRGNPDGIDDIRRECWQRRRSHRVGHASATSVRRKRRSTKAGAVGSSPVDQSAHRRGCQDIRRPGLGYRFGRGAVAGARDCCFSRGCGSRRRALLLAQGRRWLTGRSARSARQGTPGTRGGTGDLTEGLEKRVPDLRVEALPGAGHWVAYERRPPRSSVWSPPSSSSWPAGPTRSCLRGARRGVAPPSRRGCRRGAPAHVGPHFFPESTDER